MTFEEQFKITMVKTERVLAALSRLMPKIGGLVRTKDTFKAVKTVDNVLYCLDSEELKLRSIKIC